MIDKKIIKCKPTMLGLRYANNGDHIINENGDATTWEWQDVKISDSQAISNRRINLAKRGSFERNRNSQVSNTMGCHGIPWDIPQSIQFDHQLLHPTQPAAAPVWVLPGTSSCERTTSCHRVNGGETTTYNPLQPQKWSRTIPMHDPSLKIICGDYPISLNHP